jgi:hypothetical protein
MSCFYTAGSTQSVDAIGYAETLVGLSIYSTKLHGVASSWLPQRGLRMSRRIRLTLTLSLFWYTPQHRLVDVYRRFGTAIGPIKF